MPPTGGATVGLRHNEAMRTKPPDLALRRLSTRSVVLSLLLAAHPPQLSVRELIGCLDPFGITEATLRVAVSRMVARGDLHRDHSVYRLSDRLVERQRRQDDAIHPSTRAWRMHWEVAVVTATGRGPAQRAQLRDELVLLRLAELREGVWMRPANLRRAWPEHLGALTQRFTARPDQPHQVLVDTLWQIDHWAGTASTLLSAFTRAAAPADTFTVAAAIVRHLLTDPVLPEQLLPTDWPASHLRAAYAEYRSDVLRLTRNGRDAPER
jgi:phenylacetic acid degradation operon negative regulatory protein